MSENFEIVDFRQEYQPEVQQIFQNGLLGYEKQCGEYHGRIQRAFVTTKLDPVHGDMSNIHRFYCENKLNRFWVLLDNTTNSVVGCVAFIGDETKIEGELTRMSIAEAYHGKGLATKLVQHLLEFAKREGYQSVKLTTLIDMSQAIALYRKIGFKHVDTYNFPDEFIEKFRKPEDSIELLESIRIVKYSIRL